MTAPEDDDPIEWDHGSLVREIRRVREEREEIRARVATLVEEFKVIRTLLPPWASAALAAEISELVRKTTT